MTDSGIVDVHIDPYYYMNNIECTFGYRVMFHLLRDTLQNPVCIGIPLSHHHAHYTIASITGFVLLSH